MIESRLQGRAKEREICLVNWLCMGWAKVGTFKQGDIPFARPCTKAGERHYSSKIPNMSRKAPDTRVISVGKSLVQTQAKLVLLNCYPGNGSYAIENCGRDCHVVGEVTGDNAIHPPYNESNLVTDDSQLPAEVCG